MRFRTLAGIVAALLAVAGTASAQDGPISVNVGGGFTIPTSELKDVFGTGGNFEIGAILKVSPIAALQVQYGYNRLGSKDFAPNTVTPHSGLVTSIPLTANNSMHDADFNVLVGPQGAGRWGPYGIAGLGVYHRIVNLTTPAVGVGTVCDPWFYICYPTPVAIDKIVGERSHTEFGMNFGAGVTMKVGASNLFYAEVRYIHTWGPTVTDSTGAEQNANANYWPFTFGFRFHL